MRAPINLFRYKFSNYWLELRYSTRLNAPLRHAYLRGKVIEKSEREREIFEDREKNNKVDLNSKYLRREKKVIHRALITILP